MLNEDKVIAQLQISIAIDHNFWGTCIFIGHMIITVHLKIQMFTKSLQDLSFQSTMCLGFWSSQLPKNHWLVKMCSQQILRVFSSEHDLSVVTMHLFK